MNYIVTIGDKFLSTRDGMLEVVEILSNRQVKVKFLDSGNEVVTNSYNLYTKTSSTGGKMVIDKLARQKRSALQKEQDRFKEEALRQEKQMLEEKQRSLRKVKVKNNRPITKKEIDAILNIKLENVIEQRQRVKQSVIELANQLRAQHKCYKREYRQHVKDLIGYVDKGKHTIHDVENEQGEKLPMLFSSPTLSGRLWNAMEHRTVKRNEKYYKSYEGKTHDYADYKDFAEWACVQPFYGVPDYELDKDILGDGTLYSKDVCCFIPVSLNLQYSLYQRHGLTPKLKDSFEKHITSGEIPDRVREVLISII